MASEVRDEMSAAAIDEKAREWVIELQKRETERNGAKSFVARERIAMRIDERPGTVENIIRRRTKGVRGVVFEKIRAAFLREAENEIRRLEHELAIARQIGVDARCGEVAEIEASRAALLEAMRE